MRLVGVSGAVTENPQLAHAQRQVLDQGCQLRLGLKVRKLVVLAQLCPATKISAFRDLSSTPAWQ